MEINNNYLRKAEVSAKNHSQEIKNEAEQTASEQSQEYGKSLNFTGGFPVTYFGKIFKRLNRIPFRMDKDYKCMITSAQRYCELPLKDVAKVAKENKYSEDNQIFLQEMVRRASDNGSYRNAINPNDIPQEGGIVMELFQRIKEPHPIHTAFVHESKMSMADVKKCFDMCGDDPKKLEKLMYIEHDIREACMVSKEMRNSYEAMDPAVRPFDRNKFLQQKCDEYVQGFINSPNVSEYIENYRQYKGFIQKSAGKKDFVKIIDESIKNKTVVSDVKKIDLGKVLSDMPKEENFAAERFLPYYSEVGNKILEDLNGIFKPLEESAPKVVSDGYLDIYRSTTPQNKDFRRAFLERNYEHASHRKEALPEDEVTNLSKLFDYLDKDAYARKFVEDSIDRSMQSNDKYAMLQSAGDYLTLFTKYDSVQLAKDSQNVITEIARTGKNKMGAVDDYMASATAKKKPSIADFFKGIFRKEKQGTKPQDTFVPQRVSKPEQPVVEVSKPAVTPAVVQKPEVAETVQEVVAGTNIAPAVKKEAPSVKVWTKTSLAEANKQRLLDIMTNVPSKSMGKKLTILKDNVSPILRKNIKSERILNEQELHYAKNATKMRASMLPDIFESIKLTRAEAKAANGGKLPKGFVSNEDALELYSKINGKNKKLVKYMLKQTKVNADGKTERAFNVRDIINKLDEANGQIFKGKKAATKENKFTAKDEKAIYDTMLEDLTSQYGKLKKAPKAKKVSNK